MTLRGEDPNKYVNDPVLYENVVVQFKANGLSREQVHEVLQKQGFNLPLGDVPGQGRHPETLSSDSLVSKPAPHDLTELLPEDASPDLISTAIAGVEPISETETMLTLPSPGGGEVMMSPALKEDPTALALAATPVGELPPGPAKTLIDTPMSDLREGAELAFSEAETRQGEVPAPAEPEGRVGEETVVDTIPAATDTTVQQADLRITPKDLGTYSSQVQEMVAAYMDEVGSEFFSDTAELPFKADIDAVDLQIKSLNDRLEQIGEEKIKPYFGKEDTGRKILAAIAAGVGAYASAMSGTPNYALGIINKAIDDDLDKQKLEIGFRRKSLEDQRILLTTKRLELLKMTEMKLNKAWRQAQDTRAQQKIKVMLTEVLMRNDTEEKKLAQARAEALLRRYTAQLEGVLPMMGDTAEDSGITALKGPARDLVIKHAINFSILYGEAKRHVSALQSMVTKEKLSTMAPQAISALRSEFSQKITALKLLAAKKLFEFGAALTANEEKLLNDIIADADNINIALGITATRLGIFMDIMEVKRLAIKDAGGFISVGQGGAKTSSGKGALPALPTLTKGTTGVYKP